VQPDGRGQYFCPKLNKTFSTYEPRYILRFCASDFSGQQWLNAFNESATKVLCKTARETEQLLEQGQASEYDQIFVNACFKRYVFRVRARSDIYQDERRVRYDVLGVHTVDPVTETKDLLNKIEVLNQFKNQHNIQ